MKLLVIERDPVRTQALQLALAAGGHYMNSYCTTVDRALPLTRDPEAEFDCILVSSLGQTGDLSRFCASVRKWPATRATPIVILAGGEEKGQVDRAISAGATGFVRRDCGTFDLISALASIEECYVGSGSQVVAASDAIFLRRDKMHARLHNVPN